jgi:ribosomal protein L40E
MFCTRCGTQNPDDAGFCRNCSSALARPTSQPQPRAYADPSPFSNPSQPQPPPYPGYQGAPIYQSSYANQSAIQGSASGRAIASMVMSILGLVMCAFFTSIPGMILGKMEMNAIAAGQAPRAGETLAKVGFYLGIAGTVIYCLGGILWVILVSLGAAAGSFQ